MSEPAKEPTVDELLSEALGIYTTAAVNDLTRKGQPINAAQVFVQQQIQLIEFRNFFEMVSVRIGPDFRETVIRSLTERVKEEAAMLDKNRIAVS